MTSPLFIERQLNVYKLSELPFDEFTENVEIIDITNIGIFIESRSYPIDIGRFAFSNRSISSTNESPRTVNKHVVELSTYRNNRVATIKFLLEDLYISERVEGKSGKSIYEKLNCLFRFFDWCDENGLIGAIEERCSGKKALIEYTDFLQEKIRNGKLAQNTASRYQKVPAKFLSDFFEYTSVDLFMEGVRKVKRKYNGLNATQPPSDERVGKVIGLCEELFDQLCFFTLDSTNFPSKLKLQNEELWILPSSVWVAPEAKLRKRDQWSKPAWAWNYSAGRVSQPDEILREIGKNAASDIDLTTKANDMIRVAEKRLSNANKDSRDRLRLRLAQWAHDSFFLLYLASTGTNLEQAIELKAPDNDFEIEKKIRGFKSVKKRASGKEVEYLLEARMVSRLKKYLQLRQFLVAGYTDYHYLFTCLSDTSPPVPHKIRVGIVANFFLKTKSTFGIDDIKVTPRQLRAYKADYFINNYDPAVAGMMMQNSEETVLRNYSNGNEEKAGLEFSSFYKHLKDIIVFTEFYTNQSTESPVGHCFEVGAPSRQNSLDNVIEPDCRQLEGCLFCDKYSIHADKKDIRKVVSLSYVIHETRILAASDEHFDSLFGEVLGRIDFILDAIKARSTDLEDLVSSIQKDVFEFENLSYYWQKKLDMLVSLGVI